MKKYTELELAQNILDTLQKSIKKRKVAKKVIKDLEDADNIANKVSSDDLPKGSGSVMQKAKIDDHKYGKEKGGDSSIATRAMKHNDRIDRAAELGEADKKRFKTAKEKLKEKKYDAKVKENLDKCGEITKAEKPLASFLNNRKNK